MSMKKYYPTAFALYMTYFVLGVASSIMSHYKQELAALWGSSLLADGTYDAYFEPMLHVWDIAGIAAGTVVVWEAQGTLSRWDGERIHWRHDNDVVASNGLIIRELQHYLQQYPWLDSINQR